jgi:hypothetical protein
MCKPGEPCNEQDTRKSKNPNTQEMFARIEMLIVMVELYEAQDVDVPHAAIGLIDVLGPLLMGTITKAKGWDNLQMAQEVIKQKKKLFAAHGLDTPQHPMETLIEMLTEVMGEDKLREAMKNGTKA